MVEKYIISVSNFLQSNPLLAIFLLLFLIPKQTRIKILEKYLNKKLDLNNEPRPMHPEMKNTISKFTDAINNVSVNSVNAIDAMTVQIKNLSVTVQQQLIEIKKNTCRYMDKDESIEMFDIIMNNHINEKLKIVREKIEQNHWNTRSSEIMKDIETRFRIITQDGISVMSRWYTPFGDMGKILEDYIDWKRFMEDIKKILSREGKSESDIRYKLKDIEALMNRMVNDIKETRLH